MSSATCVSSKMQRQQQVVLKARPLKRRKLQETPITVKKEPVMTMDIIPSRKKKRSVSIAIEKKFLDNSLVNTALATSTSYTGAELDPATTLCLTAPAQGDGGSNRDGRQIIGKSVHIRGQIYMLPNEDEILNPPIANHVHIAVVLDTQTNNAQLNSEDVYTNPAADASVNTFPLRNMNFAKRFKILREQEFVFENRNYDRSGANVYGGAGRSASFDWFIPLNDLKINFNSTTTGVIGNVLDNSIHVVGITNATGVGGAPTISYVSRFRFLG